MAETNISTLLSEIQASRNKIRNKYVELGLAASTDKLSSLADATDNIINQGTVTATVQEGDTYTIPKGYHSGSGTVSGVSGGGNYSLQSKTVTPTKKQQNITPDSGYYGLSDVTVSPIPDAYQDVSSVNATAPDVLTGKVYVASDGTVTTGTMANNGTVSKSLDTTTTSYTIPKGYHSGTGKVSLTTETKTTTPTESAQDITPSTGKVLSKVTVNAIPSEYKDTSSADVVASDIKQGVVAFGASGAVTGTMPVHSGGSTTLNTTKTYHTIAEGYHSGQCTVNITLETKTATPTKSIQTISPTTGKVLSSVTVNAIPAEYITTTDATATAAQILDGATAYVKGEKIVGSMANNGSATNTIDGLTSMSVTIPAGYTTGGTITLTSDIEEALAAI